MLGFTLDPWRKTKKRRLVETAKFYLFDIGVANHLNPETSTIAEGSDLFGRAFEHFLLNEVRAFLAYRGPDRSLAFWRTNDGDFPGKTAAHDGGRDRDPSVADLLQDALEW